MHTERLTPRIAYAAAGLWIAVVTAWYFSHPAETPTALIAILASYTLARCVEGVVR